MIEAVPCFLEALRMLRRCLPCAALCCAALFCWPRDADPAAAQAPDPALTANVKQLVAQLGASDEDKQIAAEWALLRLGPDVLPLLPTAGGGERLRNVTATLKELLPRTFTFKSKGITLAAALKELTRQTGIAVFDRRGQKTDVPFPLTCDRLPFWEALDMIARAAHARVSLYQADGNLALVARPAQAADVLPLPVTSHGPFRIAVKGVTNRLDLETGSHTCAVKLEVAWEPRLQPFLVEVGPAVILFGKDKDGKVRKETLPSRGQDAVTGRNALEVDLRVPAPHRSAGEITLVQGTFVVTAPSKMLTFTFDRLTAAKPPGPPRTQEGVTVRLTEVVKEPDRWTFEVVIDNPRGGPRFESYQSWLGNNAIWLDKGAGTRQRLLPSAADEEILKLTATQAVVRYAFTKKGNAGVAFGEPGDWTLHYRTPGRMVEVTVPYAFKALPLP
jgi:hypothetical protein